MIIPKRNPKAMQRMSILNDWPVHFTNSTH
jgi:hypothetical protein